MNIGPAELLLGQRVADRGGDRRAGSKYLGQPLHHDRIMAGNGARGAHARCRAQRQRHHRHRVQILDDIFPARHGRHIGEAHVLQALDGAAAAGAVDHPDHRDAKRVRHFLTLGELAVQRRIGGPAAHGKVVGRGDHRAPLDIGAAEDQVARRKILERSVLGIGAAPGDLADLAKAAFVDNAGNPGPRIELAAAMLARHFLLAAHFFGKALAFGQFLKFGLPGHIGVRSSLQQKEVLFSVNFGSRPQKNAVSATSRRRVV